jgi:hypothetical protein
VVFRENVKGKFEEFMVFFPGRSGLVIGDLLSPVSDTVSIIGDKRSPF